MSIELIEIEEDDFEVIKKIYDYYIVNTTATFHTGRISVKELKEIILIGHPKYKSFLIKHFNEVCGYCYISQYKKRQAYDRTAEITIYLKPEYAGKGMGKIVMNKLEEVAKINKISVLIGIISGDNYASIKLFEKCNYTKCAHFKNIGEKFGKILDVVAYQKELY
ncbi:MAG: N-acetyltransferase [Bacteroidales bacterium]|nr:N-acetyltransferase [Bacteroidales bacterium]